MIRPLLQHLGTKLLALAMASVIWLFVSAQRRERVVERGFDVSLAVTGVPRDLIITSTPPQDALNVRLRGPISLLRSLSSQSLEAAVDLSEAREGEITVPITPRSLNVPDGVEVLTITPPGVPFRLEPRRQKFVSIRPFTVGQLTEGFEEGEITVRPERALVSGPASLIRDLTEVLTDRIFLNGRSASFQRTVGVVSDHPLVRVLEPSSVIVSVPVNRVVEDAIDSTTTGASSRIGGSGDRGNEKTLRNGRDTRKGSRVPPR